MAGKKDSKNAAAEAPEEALRASALDFAPDQDLSKQTEDLDPMNSIPTLVPNKPGFEAGQTVGGRYIGTKTVYSNKFTAAKRDEQGRMYRKLHIFQHVKSGQKFGIWGVGQLDWVMSQVDATNKPYMEVTYEGVGEVLKQGQSAPHNFKFKGAGIDLDRMNEDMEGQRGMVTDLTRGPDEIRQ